MKGPMERLSMEFTVGFKFQREWRLLIATAFFLGGIGAGLFLVSTFLDFRLGLIVGWLVVAVGKNTAHLLYLGRPLRFWRALTKPGTSWISRGIIALAAFMLFGAIHIVVSYQLVPWPPISPDAGVGLTIKVVASLAAFMVMIYTGFLMAYSPSIPFWNTSLLPLLFVTYGFMGGIGILFLILTVTGGAPALANIELLEKVELSLILFAIIIVACYLGTMFYSTIAAKESVRLLVSGALSPMFMGGVVVLGLLIPLSVAVYYAFGPGGSGFTALGLAGMSELAGGFLFRYSLLRVGVYAPVL